MGLKNKTDALPDANERVTAGTTQFLTGHTYAAIFQGSQRPNKCKDGGLTGTRRSRYDDDFAG
jgi:hypothetical protein